MLTGPIRKGHLSGYIHELIKRVFFQNIYKKEWVAKATLNLESYRKLEKDWDGYDNDAPSEELINRAIKLLTILEDKQPLPFKTMLSGHEISFYYRKDEMYVEISIEQDFEGYIYLVDDGKTPYGNDGVSELPESLFELLNSLE